MDIFQAINSKKLKKIKTILRKKPELVNKRRDGELPLHVASEKGWTDIVELLFNAHADVDAEDTNGWTPLHTACHYNHYDTMLLLLDYGADPTHRCNLGDTVLHAAARNGNVKILQRLVNYNIDLNATNFDGWTALHRAAYSNKEDAVMFLIIEGVDVDILSLSGKSAFDLALSLRHDSLAEIINSYGHRQKLSLERQRKLEEETEVTLRLSEATFSDHNTNQNNGNFKKFIATHKTKLASLFQKPISTPNNDVMTSDTTTSNSDVMTTDTTAETRRSSVAEQLVHYKTLLNKKKENLLEYKNTLKTKLFKNRSDTETENETEIRNEAAPSDASTDNKKADENENKELDDMEEDENECPVCFEVPLPPVQIYQCTNGHLYCGRCKQMPNMQKCPFCGVCISGLNNRNRFAEETIKKLYSKKDS